LFQRLTHKPTSILIQEFGVTLKIVLNNRNQLALISALEVYLAHRHSTNRTRHYAFTKPYPISTILPYTFFHSISFLTLASNLRERPEYEASVPVASVFGAGNRSP